MGAWAKGFLNVWNCCVLCKGAYSSAFTQESHVKKGTHRGAISWTTEQVTNSERERLFNACTARRDMPERIAETFNKFRKSRIGELEKLRTATTIHHSSYIMALGPSQSGKTTVKAKRRPPSKQKDDHRKIGGITTVKVGRRPPQNWKDDHR